jgi:N-acetylglucosamine-6-phosphate deacetylase
LWIGLIPDGIHVPFFVLRNFLRTAGVGRCFVVSDAIAAAGLGAGRFRIGDVAVEVEENGTAWAEGRAYFAGSTVTWDKITRNLEGALGLDAGERRLLTRENPLAAMQGFRMA